MDDRSLPLYHPHGAMIAARYQREKELLENVFTGNAAAAIRSLRAMEQDMTFMSLAGNTLDNARISVTITRTAARLAAAQAGVPPVVLNRIALRHALDVCFAQSIEEIQASAEPLVVAFCNAVNTHRAAPFSNLTTSTLEYIQQHYAGRCSVSDIAAALGVSVGALSEKFRRETGISVRAQVTEVRMHKAAQLLSCGDMPVQDIAAEVGIYDANYFIKLFKKQYGVTPGSYRRSFRL